MDWIEHAAAALAIGLPSIVALMIFITASKLTRLRLRRSVVTIADAGAVPKQVRATLDKARPLLTDLGFEFRYTVASVRTIEVPGDPEVYTDVYQHRDGRSHAMASPSTTPELAEPCTVMWATLLQSGKLLVTLNCFAHNLVCEPPQWVVHDDYLPDVRAAWERHAQHVARTKEAIVQDGMAFFRANKLSTEMLIPHAESQGLLVRSGEHWQIPWRVALRIAWRLFLGQRRAAKAQARARKSASAARLAGDAAASAQLHGVEADIAAFGQMQAVQRAGAWSGRKKFKAFLITGALFLAVGSLWISWTFLPILLAVIALHEGGHYLAMKISGYRNLSVFFVPGLGGLATGEKASASPWEKLFVYLAGPMPGIALAVAGLVGQVTGQFVPPPWFQEFLFACLVINYLNLLPVTPLDGGRVVETFLFARLPFARFLFAVLGLALFAGFGLATGDKVMLVISVFVALSLPHQWRVMRVDRAIARNESETLDERGALERVFSALQHPKFADWPFATRAAAAAALLPELQGRRAGAAEAAGGLAIYLGCLLAPFAAAVVAVPQFGAILAIAGHREEPDDVDPEPRDPRMHQRGRDWTAEAGRAQSLAEPQRIAVFLGAAEVAAVSRDGARRDGYLEAAWDIAQHRQPRDLDRARTLMAMARHHQQRDARMRLYGQVAGDLAGAPDRPSLLLLAEAKSALAYHAEAEPARVALLRQVVEHREQAQGRSDFDVTGARTMLARSLDKEGGAAEAEGLLRRNVESIPVPSAADRSREGLTLRTRRVGAQVELAWFLIAHKRPQEAAAVLQLAAAAVPQKVTVSWEHPNRMVREATLWARLQSGDAAAVQESWRSYEEARRGLPPVKPASLQHELDRLIVAQALQDAALRAQATEGIARSRTGSQFKFAHQRLCEAQEASWGWRTTQRETRLQAASAAGLCAKG